MLQERDNQTLQELGNRLIEGAMAGNLQGVRELISHGADINFANMKGVTPLMMAAHWDRVDVVRFLVENGADVRLTEKTSDRGALMYSCLSPDPQPIELILEAGAEVNAKDRSGRTALMMAAINGILSGAELLVKAGANVNAQDEFGLTAWDLAAKRGHKEVVALLSSKGSVAGRGKERP